MTATLELAHIDTAIRCFFAMNIASDGPHAKGAVGTGDVCLPENGVGTVELEQTRDDADSGLFFYNGRCMLQVCCALATTFDRLSKKERAASAARFHREEICYSQPASLRTVNAG